jgi:hypothetical protein
MFLTKFVGLSFGPVTIMFTGANARWLGMRCALKGGLPVVFALKTKLL